MISNHTRQRIRAIYAFRCGYCGVTESDVGAELTIDHFHPQSQGGNDEIDNLVYACFACNGFKGAVWTPESPTILHPLRDDLAQHFAEQPDGTLLPLTDAGDRHITALHLNRAPLVRRRRDEARFQEIVRVQAEMNEAVTALERSIRAIERSMIRLRNRRR